MRKRVIAALLSLFCTVSFLSLPASAAGTDDSKTSKLTLYYKDQDFSQSSVSFSLYKVGEYSSAPEKGVCSFTPVNDFSDAAVTLTAIDFWNDSDASLLELAKTLASNVEGKDALKTGSTDDGDKLTFTGLGSGLYLVLGDPKTFDGKVYNAQPLLIPLPYPARVTDLPSNYSVIANVKFDSKDGGSGTPDPEPGTPDPEPGTPDPGPGTPEPEPGTPEPGTPGPNTPNIPGTPGTAPAPGTGPAEGPVIDIPDGDTPLSDLTPENIQEIFNEVPLTPEDLETLIDLFTETPLANMTVDEVMEIFDEDVPLSNMTSEELVDLFEDLVPLVGAPKTGDNVLIWVSCALISGAGLVWLYLIDKKRKGSAD